MSKFNVKIFSLFPEMFPPYLENALLGRGLKNGLWNYEVIQIRDYATDRYQKVDDTPFGGGHGMVMKPDVVAAALDANCDDSFVIYYMSPRGRLFNQDMAPEIIKNQNIAIVCGRYEGLDQRVIDEYNMREISIGDYVLTGGEMPAMVVLDACVRCLDGVLGDGDSVLEDSFGGGGNDGMRHLLEYPLYTKPAEWRGRRVPEVLISGHHKKIQEWKINEAKRITAERRPDLCKISDGSVR